MTWNAGPRGESLDRDGAIEARVVRLPDLAHAACAGNRHKNVWSCVTAWFPGARRLHRARLYGWV